MAPAETEQAPSLQMDFDREALAARQMAGIGLIFFMLILIVIFGVISKTT